MEWFDILRVNGTTQHEGRPKIAGEGAGNR